MDKKNTLFDWFYSFKGKTAIIELEVTLPNTDKYGISAKVLDITEAFPNGELHFEFAKRKLLQATLESGFLGQ